jgi:hypothetical protein|tara:strand:- start:650 stop:1648 length:999 start_codon:yes stop_codon:yes gene_type:complete
MIFVDDKYIGMVSSRLNKFAKKKNGLYNFRCPYCGDSQKHKNKARGYLYIVKNDYNFKCHNCGTTRTLANFLKDHDTVLHDQYVMERYKRGATGKRSNTAAPKFKFEKPVFEKRKQELDLNKVSNLNKEHPARIYLEQNRQLPSQALEDMYYVENFKEWTNTKKQTFDSVENDESRIIIPLRYNGKIIGYQGRALLPSSKIKYITIMLEEDAPKVFGLDKISNEDPVYVVEGPIDSYFIGNAIAMCGSDVDLRSLDYKFIFVYDNEPRNREIVNKISSTIERGNKVVVFPKEIMEKDLNDMHLNGLDVQRLVESNIYQGLEAKLKLQSWKRV